MLNRLLLLAALCAASAYLFHHYGAPGGSALAAKKAPERRLATHFRAPPANERPSVFVAEEQEGLGDLRERSFGKVKQPAIYVPAPDE